MNFKTEKKPLIEAALIASLAAVFVIITLYIPILTILIFILPVPFIILGVRHPIKYVIMALLFVCLIVGALTDILYTLFIFIIFGPISIAMGYLIKRESKEFEIIVAGTLASSISIFLAIQIIGLISGINFVSQVAELFREAFYNQMNLLTQINVSELRINETINYFISIFPALIIVQSMIGAVINYYLSILVLKRSTLYRGHIPSFGSFRLPKNIIFGFFLLVLLALLTRYIEGIYYESLLYNIITIFMFLLFLQGIAVIVFFMEKLRINRVLKIFLIGIFILMGALFTFVAIAGFIDAVFNIRKLDKG